MREGIWHGLYTAAPRSPTNRLKIQIGKVDELFPDCLDELIKQYVAAHYLDIQTIRFKIFISRETGYITDVLLDDRAIMQSVWVAMNKALTEKGVNENSLPTYRVLEAHQMEYIFSS